MRARAFPLSQPRGVLGREGHPLALTRQGTTVPCTFPRLPLSNRYAGAAKAATFSPELADLTIYVIDVAAGDKIPRKGGPGITRSDLLVINKTDLAPLVGADLSVMERDTNRMRGTRPFQFTNIRSGDGVDKIAQFVISFGGLDSVSSLHMA